VTLTSLRNAVEREMQARDEGASDTCHRAHLREEKTSFAFYSVTEFSMDNGENIDKMISKAFGRGFSREGTYGEEIPCGISGVISSRHSNGIKSETRAALVKCRTPLPSTKRIMNERFYDAGLHRETRKFL